MIYLHLKAKNDGNGRPQRLFLVLSKTGEIVEAIKERLDGDHVKAKHPNIYRGPDIDITVGTYKHILKYHNAEDQTC